MTWLVAHYGVAKLLDLMRAYRATTPGRTSTPSPRRLLRQVYGVTRAEVTDGAFGLLASPPH